MQANTLSVRVRSRTPVAQGIVAFELEAVDGVGPLPGYQAGSHIDVHLPGGLIRQYSLCGKPDQMGVYRIAVLLEESGRGGSRAMHTMVAPGDVLTIGTPRNAFALKHANHCVSLMAGGVGITPILAMAYALEGMGADFRLHYFARTRARLAFLPELEDGPLAAHLVLHVDDEPNPNTPDLAMLMQTLPAETDIYACGPQGFLDQIQSHLAQRVGSRPTLYFESFKPIVAMNNGGEFEVQFARSQRKVLVGRQESIVEAAVRVGVHIPVSCEQGICGTCLTPVLEGQPEHRDSYLTQDEQDRNDQMTPCCSRARSATLVLNC